MSVEPHKRSELKTSYFEAGFHYRQSRCRSRNLRLVFTIDRVGVGVVIRSVELYDLLKTAFWFRWRSSENWLVGVACRSGKTKPIRTKRGNVHCDWFILPLLLPTPTIWFSLDHKRNEATESEENANVPTLRTPIPSSLWLHIFSQGHKRSYDSDSDSVASEKCFHKKPSPRCILFRVGVVILDPCLESPDNFSGPKSSFMFVVFMHSSLTILKTIQWKYQLTK